MERHQKKKITRDDMLHLLDACYEKSKDGLGKLSPPIERLAEDYLKKDKDPKVACKKMLKNQIKKCTTSGVVTGFGGAIILPITIPANISSVLYVQMRMVSCTAYMAGLDLDADQVQTFVFACLAGVSVNEVVKQTGIKFGMKVVEKGIEKIPRRALVKINQKIGFRFLTKFGEKGIINLGKLLPGVGAAINGVLDYAETKIIADRAYKMFFEGDFTAGEKPEDEITDEELDEVIEAEVVEIDDIENDAQLYEDLQE